jgi:hypothetical protein
MSCHLSLTIQNASGQVRTVRFEPWAREFTTVPDEKLEVIVTVESGTPSLRVVEAIATTLIYIEECDGVCVVQAGITIDLAQAAPVRPSRDRDSPMWDRELDF